MERLPLAGGRWWTLVVALVVSLWPALGLAAVPVPPGWRHADEVSAEANDRAEAWASGWSAGLSLVCSTPDDDGFAETLAVLEVSEPLPEEILGDTTSAQAWLEPRLRSLLGPGAEPELESLALVPRPTPGVAIIRARLQLEDRVVLIAVAPKGAQHQAVVLTYESSDEILYGGVFEASIDGMSDLHPPIAPFPRTALRWLALLSWLALGALLGLGWTRRNLPRPGAKVAGRQVGAMLVASAALVLVLAGLGLGGYAVELGLAGTTPWGFAIELAMGGVIAAVAVVLGTNMWEQRLRPVASAPQQGTYATAGVPQRRASSVSPAAEPNPTPAPSTEGGTQIGPPPGPPPTTAGGTQIGPAPTAPSASAPPAPGGTRVGPPPAPPTPPSRDAEVTVARPHPAAGLTDIDPRVQPRVTGITHDTHPRYRRTIPGVTDVAAAQTRSGSADGPASLVDANEALQEEEAYRSPRASQSDLFPKADLERRPGPGDGHPALDAPMPPPRSGEDG